MIDRIVFAPVLGLMASINPASAIPDLPAGFEFVNQSVDGETHFMKKVAKQGNKIYTQMITIEPDGSLNEWIQPFNCKNKSYLKSDKTWASYKPKSVGEEWIKVACH